MSRSLILLEGFKHIALDEDGVARFIQCGIKISTIIEGMIIRGDSISGVAHLWALPEEAISEAYVEYLNGNLFV